MRAGAWLALAVLGTGCAGTSPAPVVRSAGAYAMGTALEMTLVGADAPALDRALADAFAEVERLEALLSSWRAASDVSRLNAAAGVGAVPVDPEVAALLARSLALSRETRGSFDVTVGPLVALWREAEERGLPPSPEEIAAVRDRVGEGRMRVEADAADGAQAFLEAGSAVDLGGIAKGYALDRVRAQLPAGVGAALLSFGQSSAWAIGRPPDAAGWRLLARAPDGGFAGVLTLRDRALSVSGSLGQWREIAGHRYGHVLDPRSGQPLTRRLQALVVGDDATAAEALSKALLVLGPVDGVGLVEAWPGAEALLLDEDGRSWRTAGWDAATAFEETGVPGAAAGACCSSARRGAPILSPCASKSSPAPSARPTCPCPATRSPATSSTAPAAAPPA